MSLAVIEWLASHPGSTLTEVNLCNIDELTTGIFSREAEILFAAQADSE
jgi:hypothetical protein